MVTMTPGAPTTGRSRRGRGTRAILALVLLAAAGCETRKLAPTPNLYLDTETNPFADVAPEQRSVDIEVFYFTDRGSEQNALGRLAYGYERSPSLAAGATTVRVGEGDLTWDELVTESRVRRRTRRLPLTVTRTEETVRFPHSSPPFVEVDGERRRDPANVAERARAEAEIRRLIDEELATRDRREVFLFVHGVNNTFEDAAFRIAELWHFMGRVGVPVFYTWPAGRPGFLRGYTRDRESGEFTVYHLRQAIEALAASPNLEKLHIIAHSRGTDVVMTALRELHLLFRGAGLDTREELKLGNVILAAPDLDAEVFGQRVGAEQLELVPERLTVYLSSDDRAIRAAQWLFASARRIGAMRNEDVSPEVRESLRLMPELQFIDVDATTDWLGHGYFVANPAVLSDMILVLRDGLDPGAENGRPLVPMDGGFWKLPDGYPGPGPAADGR